MDALTPMSNWSRVLEMCEAEANDSKQAAKVLGIITVFLKNLFILPPVGITQEIRAHWVARAGHVAEVARAAIASSIRK